MDQTSDVDGTSRKETEESSLKLKETLGQPLLLNYLRALPRHKDPRDPEMLDEYDELQ